jgi:hypothetical protein
MPRIALTDRFGATARPLGARTDYFDTTVTGLALRLSCVCQKLDSAMLVMEAAENGSGCDLPPSDGAKGKLGNADLKEGYHAEEKAFG